MNRKTRRSELKRGGRNATLASLPDGVAEIDRLFSEAGRAYQDGQLPRARDICRQILALDPSHIGSNNLLGVVFQSLGHDKIALKHFAKAIALDHSVALFHYNIAFSYQRLGLWDDAVAHFTRAITL